MFTNLLSAITGQFTRALVLGAFVPSLLFIILAVIFVVPLFPPDSPILEPLKVLGTESPIIAVAFFTILFTGLLYNLNNLIIRFFMGYTWQRLPIGVRRTEHYQDQFDLAQAQRAGMRTLTRAMVQRQRDAESIEDVNKKRTRVAHLVNTEFPHRRSLVLPTQLGNVIRNFETYPNRQYGIDGPSLWPRLIAKVAPDYGGAVGDAKTSFDFVLNSVVLSGLLSLTILVAGLLNPLEVVDSPQSAAQWAALILAFTVLACILYLALIDRAKAWGEMFAGAFDLYRKELLAQLGYERKFDTVAEESTFWEIVSRQTAYGYPPAGMGPPMDYMIAPISARSSTREADLEIARGVAKTGSDGKVRITVRVENTNGEHDAENVVVTDTLADGFHYLWGSARVVNSDGTVNENVRVRGTNPYDFDIGNIGTGESAVLKYRVVRIADE